MSQSPGSGRPADLPSEATMAGIETDNAGHSDGHSNGDPMDVAAPSSHAGNMGPPLSTSLEDTNISSVSATNHVATTGAAGTGPKVVQTAFIHKLYSMLEDSTIQHLISWSANNESFVMSPTADFAKVLSQYFKHTNVSSFVRQLNMYGFHKVSDVFHTGSPESTLWEFKHGNGHFRRGDLASLRDIKRRASRHALITRDSYTAPSVHKPSVAQAPAAPDTSGLDHDSRLANLEHGLFEMHNRLARSEEGNHALAMRCHSLNDGLVKSYQYNVELARLVTCLVADIDHPIRIDALKLEKDALRQLDTVRNNEDPHESLLSGRQPFFSNMALQEPGSPRVANGDDRRTSLQTMAPRYPSLRPAMNPPPSNNNAPQRRYGSIGSGFPPPSSHRPFHSQTQLPPQNPQHPLSNVTEAGGNLGRRHTTADLRAQHGWQANTANSHSSPLASGQSSTHFPSSPTQLPQTHPLGMSAPQHQGDHQIVREQLAAYEFGKPRQSVSSVATSTMLETPSLSNASTDTTPSTLGIDSNWPWGTQHSSTSSIAQKLPPASGPMIRNIPPASFPPPLIPPIQSQDSSGAQTRRSSMASNVHSLLNPTEASADGGATDDSAPPSAMSTGSGLPYSATSTSSSSTPTKNGASGGLIFSEPQYHSHGLTHSGGAGIDERKRKRLMVS